MFQHSREIAFESIFDVMMHHPRVNSPNFKKRPAQQQQKMQLLVSSENFLMHQI